VTLCNAEVSIVTHPSMSGRSTNGYWLVLIALVLGLILGAGAVGLMWFVSSHGTGALELSTTDTSLDATTACADLARVPAPSPTLTVLARARAACVHE
jgi:hypothetical protein